MLVLDGSPGAGKTTVLGRLLETAPDEVIVFPEAQPPADAGSEEEVLTALLDEDSARITAAARLRELNPSLVVTSDRCHIGVLAYRYALTVTGRAPARAFEQAVSRASELRLDLRHQDDTVVVLRLAPARSIQRRAVHARDPRFQLWYDLEFLSAYNDFLDHLDRWMHIGADWHVCDAEDQTSWGSLLPIPIAVVGQPRRRLDTTPPGCGCNNPRSSLVASHGVATRLYTSAIHRGSGTGASRCLRTAETILADLVNNTVIGVRQS